MPGGAPLPGATAPTAAAWSRATPSRRRARNRRDCTGCSATPPAGEARAGTQVFAQASCGGCHTLAAAAADARGRVGPNLDELRPDYERVASQVRDGGKGMPAFADRLSDREIQSVAAYVADVAGRQ